jgi:hypothetical protein
MHDRCRARVPAGNARLEAKVSKTATPTIPHEVHEPECTCTKEGQTIKIDGVEYVARTRLSNAGCIIHGEKRDSEYISVLVGK